MEPISKTVAQAVAAPRWRHGLKEVELLNEPKVRVRKKVHRDWEILPGTLQMMFLDLCAGRSRWPLFLHGKPGRGKTLAAYCFCDRVVDAAWLDINRLITALVTPESPWWAVVEDREFLVLDELGGRDKVHEVEYNALKKCLDIRESNADRVGVYLSNHPPERITTLYDDRTASRLLCGTIFHLEGPDRRKSDD